MLDFDPIVSKTETIEVQQIIVLVSIRFQVPDTRLYVPGSSFQTPGSRFKIQDSSFQTPGSRFKSPDSRLTIPDSRFQDKRMS